MNDGDATIEAAFRGTLGTFALDVAFTLPMRGITALFGPSGSGKTTVLRCIAGLTHLPGRLIVGGAAWQDEAAGTFLRPHERPIGYVFQEASLFAHLSVRANLLYGHRRALRQGTKETVRLDDIVRILGIGHLLDRATGALSGGERQRVAVGRALLSQPRLLLMDEPLSALDRMTKEEILPYFEALHASLSIPALYISHDMAEVERLADHMVLLDAGHVVAAGPLDELLADTQLPIVSAPAAATVLAARVGAYLADDGLTELVIDGERLLAPGRIAGEEGVHRVRIAAADVSLAVNRPSLTTILNVLPVRIRQIEPLGAAQVNVIVTLGHRDGGHKLLVRVTRRAQRLLDLRVGQDVFAQIKAVSLVSGTRG